MSHNKLAALLLSRNSLLLPAHLSHHILRIVLCVGPRATAQAKIKRQCGACSCQNEAERAGHGSRGCNSKRAGQTLVNGPISVQWLHVQLPTPPVRSWRLAHASCSHESRMVHMHGAAHGWALAHPEEGRLPAQHSMHIACWSLLACDRSALPCSNKQGSDFLSIVRSSAIHTR